MRNSRNKWPRIYWSTDLLIRVPFSRISGQFFYHKIISNKFLISKNQPLIVLFSAIEAWVIVCVLFVFGALIEYAGLLLKIKISTTRGTPRLPKKSPSGTREGGAALALNGGFHLHLLFFPFVSFTTWIIESVARPILARCIKGSKSVVLNSPKNERWGIFHYIKMP